jgi:hypothetical protein
MTDLDRPYHGTPSTEPLWGSLRKPGEPPAPTTAEWIERIAHGSTPAREYDAEGRFVPWIRRDVA